jgi:hypothetical protein
MTESIRIAVPKMPAQFLAVLYPYCDALSPIGAGLLTRSTFSVNQMHNVIPRQCSQPLRNKFYASVRIVIGFKRKSESASSDSLHLGSNVILNIEWQLLKQPGEIVSIDAGRWIDRSDRQSENADSPRVKSLEPGSNVKFESPSQRRKQNAEIVSIDDGREID